MTKKKSNPEFDPEPDPDPLVRGTNPWVPDPDQNVTDPQHWCSFYVGIICKCKVINVCVSRSAVISTWATNS